MKDEDTMPENPAEITNTQHFKWHEKPSVILLAIIALGPFAIPLIWRSRAISTPMKWVSTIILIALTVWFLRASVSIYQKLVSELDMLQDVLGQAR